MKKTFFFCSFAPIVAFVAGLNVGQPKDLSREVKIYEEYYKASESLLDTLNSEYNWVDAFDPEDYYEAAKKVKALR